MIVSDLYYPVLLFHRPIDHFRSHCSNTISLIVNRSRPRKRSKNIGFLKEKWSDFYRTKSMNHTGFRDSAFTRKAIINC